MGIWFLCKLSYQQQEENGKVTKVKEQYLIDAMSFTEAEARVYEELGSALPEFILQSVNKMNLQEIFHYEDQETWYKAKVVFIDVDEKTGKEKKTVNTMLVTADSVKQACERIEESLGTLMVTWQITDVGLTPIIEIFPYVDDRENNEDVRAFAEEVDLETGEVVAAAATSESSEPA
ncbi:protein of unknown function [Catalinimonas alkaloidigena]|uniref:DUF4494 domain-containing protein n=1 Tax=Catalinimonas alkaloidigena TaxID=1075417 RepID=A0A1G8WSH2_9BACT|nr:DUF4494 domain-containing protein [Catalinimonas alkaloidigena]SDJ81083.1 protein of unknown function [Catalinimonas alkaloidigena]